MSFRPHGKARVDPNNPQAEAICDRCGFRFNHVDLRKSVEWRGTKLVQRSFLNCEKCQDVPNDQMRTNYIPADPVPVRNPRPRKDT